MTGRMRLTLQGRRNLVGVVFSLPFIIGFLLFFVRPILQSLSFSLSELEITADGYLLHFVGLANYHDALFVQVGYLREVVTTVSGMAGQAFLILSFAFFAAVVVNQPFRGRLLARVILFLPVILGAGIILRLEQQDYMMQALEHGLEESGDLLGGVFGAEALQGLLLQLRLPEQLTGYVLTAIDGIPQIVNASGVQILIFLAGLQSIPPSLYEAADVEGATGWESFWMITLPMLSPLILTCIVYTVVDFFTAVDNAVVLAIRRAAFVGGGYGISAAMAWMYFALIAVVLGFVFVALSRFVFYQE